MKKLFFIFIFSYVILYANVSLFESELSNAQKGDKASMFNTGLLYYHGVGVEKNISEAIKWYQKAADKGSVEAMTNLGHIYLNGIVVAKDELQALNYYY